MEWIQLSEKVSMYVPIFFSLIKHTPFFSFHLCTYNDDGKSHCGGDSGGPLVMVDAHNDGR